MDMNAARISSLLVERRYWTRSITEALLHGFQPTSPDAHSAAVLTHRPRFGSPFELQSRARPDERYLAEVRLPGRLDHVPVGIAALHAHVLRLVPPFDDRHAVRDEPVVERVHVIGTRQMHAEVQEPREPDRLVRRAECQREPVRAVEHQHATVIAALRLGAEAEVPLVERSRALLVGHGEREMLHDFLIAQGGVNVTGIAKTNSNTLPDTCGLTDEFRPHSESKQYPVGYPRSSP